MPVTQCGNWATPLTFQINRAGMGVNDFRALISVCACLFGSSIQVYSPYRWGSCCYCLHIPCGLSSANVFPFVVDMAPANSLLLERECTTERACSQGKQIKSVSCGAMRNKCSEVKWGESDETVKTDTTQAKKKDDILFYSLDPMDLCTTHFCFHFCLTIWLKGKCEPLHMKKRPFHRFLIGHFIGYIIQQSNYDFFLLLSWIKGWMKKKNPVACCCIKLLL